MRHHHSLLICLLLFIQPAGAAIYTWSGGSPSTANGDWTTANNWVGQTAPVSAADTDLVFGATTAGGSGRTTASNNIADPFNLRTLTFNSSAPSSRSGPDLHRRR